MSQTVPSDPRGGKAGSNRHVAAGLVAFVAFMVGLSFAAVPFYRMFCAATGYAGTPQRADRGSSTVYPETLIIRFDTNVTRDLPWTFEPVEREVKVHIGENRLAFFRATNNSNKAVTGQAIFNVTPELMGQYFTKVQCFCFTEQTLKPGESVEMPVSFYVDPAFLKDSDFKSVHDMTLSYTFYRVQKTASLPVPPPAARADASPLGARNPG